jgi:hypothetical protein
MIATWPLTWEWRGNSPDGFSDLWIPESLIFVNSQGNFPQSLPCTKMQVDLHVKCPSLSEFKKRIDNFSCNFPIWRFLKVHSAVPESGTCGKVGSVSRALYHPLITRRLQTDRIVISLIRPELAARLLWAWLKHKSFGIPNTAWIWAGKCGQMAN